MELTIKCMETEEEMRGKAYVHWKAWHEAYTGLISDAFLDGMTLEKCERIAFRYPQNTLIAVADGQVVGFVAYGAREETPSVGEVFGLYVLRDRYGMGVGLALLNAALAALKAFDSVCLWVLKDNARAIRFYEKCGFLPDGAKVWSEPLQAEEMRMIRTPTQEKA